jgi:putative oxidoreductase
MKIALIIIRSLFGLLFLFASVTYFLKLMPQPEMQGNVKLFMQGMEASVYLMPTVKFVELICALAFISGRFVPLATVMIFPITLNILLYNVFLSPEGAPMGIVLLLVNLFMAYYYRKNYVTLVAAK